MKSDLPSGTVTFLFTDIEGSTQLAQKFSIDLPALFARHKDILKQAFEAHRGFVFQVVGDSFSVAFHTAMDALQAAIAAQRALQNETWSPASIRVRMGIHTGAAELAEDASVEGPYSGYTTLALTQRIMSAAYGGQVLLSQVTRDLVGDGYPADLTLQDMGEHRFKDVLQPLHIYQVMAQGLRTHFPPLKTLELFPQNLPTPLTSFIGREHEIAEVKQLLARTRLLTLAGPGGTGKTRLSLRVAEDLQQSFPDGVWFVELAPLMDPLLIPQTIASVFGLRELQNIHILEILMDYLRRKQILLVLDNCEHLAEACAQLSDRLLRNCPPLTILASSREVLGMAGETVYHVPPLSLPDPAKVTSETFLESEAARLFLERATAAHSKFHLTEKNMPAIELICRHLDGMPLALELAAARVHVFSVEEIASRLDERFKLLTSGSRTALPRHQTLRALIDWSYDLLSPEEQTLFRQLSVFSDGWTLEAAEQVCSNLAVLTLLPQLVNKSLVRVEEPAEARRYHLLETIRHYAIDRLVEAGELQTAGDRHLAFFLQLAEQADANLNRPQELQWLSRLDADYGNLRAALEWSQKNDLQAALRLGGALAMFWVRRGYVVEGRQWLADVLARANQLPEESRSTGSMIPIRARALLGMGLLAFSMGDAVSTNVALEECVVLSEQIGDRQIRSWALAYLSTNRAFEGDMNAAYSFAEEGLRLSRETGEQIPLAMALGNMALGIRLMRNDSKTSTAYFKEAMAILDEAGAGWYKAMASFSFGLFEALQGNYAEAHARFDACQPLFVEYKDRHRLIMVRSELAHLERRHGHLSRAKELYRETIQQWQELGHRAAVAHQLECFAMLAKAQEDERRAAGLFGAAEALREKNNLLMQHAEQMEYDSEVSQLRAGTDENDFAKAWAEGRALSMEQAILVALEDPQVDV